VRRTAKRSPEPRDTEWKSRAFELVDPSGFLLTVFSDKSA
jgi:hypothetical protein